MKPTTPTPPTTINPNQALWEKGDFTRIAATMRRSGEALVSRLGVQAGHRILDLGCGDGTTALPAAQRGADVLGVDIARNLVAAGNRRAREHGLDCLKFEEGDACNLHALADRSFDLVVTIFGAMFAPKPQEVANELVRVTRPGGRIVMGNWIPRRPHTGRCKSLRSVPPTPRPLRRDSSARCFGAWKSTSSDVSPLRASPRKTSPASATRSRSSMPVPRPRS